MAGPQSSRSNSRLSAGRMGLPILFVALGLSSFSGCAYWRSLHGMDSAPSPTVTPTTWQTMPPPPEFSAPPASGPIVQAGNQVRQDEPLLLPQALEKEKNTAPANPPAPSGPAAPPNPSQSPVARMHELARAAVERYQNIDSYIARMRRRERVGGADKPEELMLVKFRKTPWSIYFKWLGNEGHGREVLFVEGKYENKLQTLLAAGDVPLMPAGRRFAIAPDSSLVMRSSRHTIREAGIGSLVERFSRLITSTERGDFRLGTVHYVGPVRRPEYEQPCEAVEQTLLPGNDPSLPRGGHRLWVIDTVQNLPVLISTHDEKNQEVEYYCYDRIQNPVSLDDRDFDPDVLWPKKR
jgi:hypothetical protein